MSDSKESDEPKALSLSGPRRLELKKTVETGQVRQSFSHGRSKTVQVEVRKKRTFRREGDKLVKSAPALGVASEPADAPAFELEDEPQGRPSRQLTQDEKAARMRALQGAQREADDARKIAEAEAQALAVEEAERAAAEEAERARAAEEESRRAEEDKGQAAQAEDQEQKRRADKPAEEPIPAEPQPLPEKQEAAELQNRGRRPVRAVPPKAPATRRQPSERRRGGKLTISKALDDNRGERQHSLAAFRRRQERDRRSARQQQSSEPPKRVIRDVVIPESITIAELSNRMAERTTDVVKSLMKLGTMVNVNQTIDADTAEVVVSEFGHRSKRVSEADVEIGLTREDVDESGPQRPRAPIVTVMGHVDHGKTSLLDALRKTDVAAKEAGGITQHIGAYQVKIDDQRKVTFIDTPGHEAFTAMRARGANVTDLIILVVAADDSVMPQTIEAIHHAKAAGVPIIVAINKCDRPDADPTRVRNDLLQHDVIDESVGGDVLSVEVSAVTGDGLDKLLETLLLQSEMLELKANPDRAAFGTVIESKLEHGRGAVATVLVRSGTLRIGDILVAGAESGRVRALIDDHGQNVDAAGPAMPVEVLGLQNAPTAGDDLSAVESEARAREVAEFRQRRNRDAQAVAGARGSLEQMLSAIKEGKASELPIVVKADVQGSVEAIIGAADKFATEEVKVRVLHGGVGGITESDVSLAHASDAMIVGFNVRANKQARELAQQDGVEIRYYSIIYELTEDLKALLSGMLEPERREHVLGSLQVREVFNVSKVGKVAGCMVTDGLVRRGARVRLLRDSVVVHDGKLGTLRRFKDDVREVKDGYECGIALDSYQDMQIGDVVEAYEVEEVARTL